MTRLLEIKYASLLSYCPRDPSKKGEIARKVMISIKKELPMNSEFGVLFASEFVAKTLKKIIKKDKLEITWDTAYAADAPLSHYEIFQGDKKVAAVKHHPQITKQPFTFNDRLGEGDYRVVTVDKAGNRAESGSISFS